MDKDRIKGAIKQAIGSAKSLAGRVAGDKKLEADGSAQKAEGKAQNAVAGVKDTFREIVKK